MLGLRLTTDAQARAKKGHPAHHTTGVAHASCSQFDAVRSISAVTRLAEQHLAHREGEDGEADEGGPPEPARHVVELGVGGVGHHRPRLEGHAARRAALPARRCTTSGVHRARVLDGRLQGVRAQLRVEGHAALRAHPRPELPHPRAHRAREPGLRRLVGRQLGRRGGAVTSSGLATGRRVPSNDPGRLRTSPGSPRNRSSRSARHGRGNARRGRGPRTSRTPGRWRSSGGSGPGRLRTSPGSPRNRSGRSARRGRGNARRGRGPPSIPAHRVGGGLRQVMRRLRGRRGAPRGGGDGHEPGRVGPERGMAPPRSRSSSAAPRARG